MNSFAARAFTLLALGLAACSNQSTGFDHPSGAPAADAPPPSSGDGGERAAADAAVATVNGCTGADFAENDRTAESAERIIRAPDDATPAQFSPHCMRVRVGQTITWTGELKSYSISYKLVSTTNGGFSNSAGPTKFVIGDEDGGDTKETAEASEPMTISFTVADHPTTMFGAVDVVP